VEILEFFHRAFELLFYPVKPYLRDSSKKYILTGHSLGGALASLLAVRMTQNYEVNKFPFTEYQSAMFLFQFGMRTCILIPNIREKINS